MSTLEPIGGGNGCDGLALRWLLKQAKPRVWVSDQGVTGVGDIGSLPLLKDCIGLVNKGEVYCFKGVQEFTDALEGRNLRRGNYRKM